MESNEEKRSITSYLDYREFLRDIYDSRKKAFESYSYLQFAADMGFSPTNVLRLVIHGKRSLAPKSAQKVAKNLGLSHIEKKYFLALVAYNDAKSPNLKRNKFISLLELKSKCSNKSRDSISYFSHWSRPVVREVMRILPAQNPEDSTPKKQISDFSINEIAEKLRNVLYPDLRVPKCKETLEFLAQEKYLIRDDMGSFVTKNNEPLAILGDESLRHLGMMRFHKEMIDVSQECLIKVPHDEREFNAVTLCITENDFKVLQNEIRNLCARAMELEKAATKKDRVVQMNIQLFNITKPMGEEV